MPKPRKNKPVYHLRLTSSPVVTRRRKLSSSWSQEGYGLVYCRCGRGLEIMSMTVASTYGSSKTRVCATCSRCNTSESKDYSYGVLCPEFEFQEMWRAKHRFATAAYVSKYL